MTKTIAKEAATARLTDRELGHINEQLGRRIERHAVELQAARAEMDTLAHTISHDLRSPLTVIGGFAELLSKHSGKVLDGKGRHYLERITTSTESIARMIDSILAFSRMSRSELHLVPVDLDALVGKVVHEFDASKGERRVTWLLGRLPTVAADPTLLRQAFTSLVSNALRFTRSREVARIQIGAQSGDHEITLFVRDNGAGIDVKHRERAFDGHHPAQNPAEPDASAIGLAYVQRIVQRHGGRTWTEAVPDGGATFCFSLPDESAEPEFRAQRR
jgi:light-regulated signal transduction histidine kinase (bacteriophytochrome)